MSISLLNQRILKYLNIISKMDINSLSISQAYDTLESLKQEANNILEVNPYEKKK